VSHGIPMIRGRAEPFDGIASRGASAPA
jgi:hypothetical protein